MSHFLGKRHILPVHTRHRGPSYKSSPLHRPSRLHSLSVESFEAFRTAAANADELLARLGRVATAADADEDLGPGRPLSRMIARVVEDKAPGETFGPKTVTLEIRKRWGAKLRTKVDPRNVAATLRRWALRGRIQRTREGRARYESLYVKKKGEGIPPPKTFPPSERG